MSSSNPEVLAYQYEQEHKEATVSQSWLDGYFFATQSKNSPDLNHKIELCVQRKKKFGLDLSGYLKEYGKDMLTEFYNYWTELNKSKTKMKFENEKTWELNLRLKRWYRNGQKRNYSSRQAKATPNIYSVAEEVLNRG